MPADAGVADADPNSAAGAGGESGALEAGPPPAGDTCDEPVEIESVASVGADGTLLVTGSNTNGATDLEACDSFNSPVADVVYRYVAPATGGLRWNLENVTLTRFIVDVRTTCDDVASNLQCDECGLACNGDLEVTEGDTLFFVISGVTTTESREGTGTFELSLLLTADPALGEACVSPYEGGRACPEGSVCQAEADEPAICGAPSCGDGFLSFEPLECEDGNTVPDDGCSADCQVDAQGPGGETCSAPVTLNLPPIRGLFDSSVWHYAVASGDFVGGSDEGATCASADGPEAVYVFDLDAPGHVEITAQNAEVLSLREAGASDCGSASDELGCTSGAASDALLLDFEVLPVGRYAVILDREQPTSASTDTYTLDVVVDPAP